jgi:hypothetical protein
VTARDTLRLHRAAWKMRRNCRWLLGSRELSSVPWHWFETVGLRKWACTLGASSGAEELRLPRSETLHPGLFVRPGPHPYRIKVISLRGLRVGLRQGSGTCFGRG